MRKQRNLTIAAAISAALLAPGTMLCVQAQTVQQARQQGPEASNIVAPNAQPGRIPKFVNANRLNNSVLFQSSSGRIGLGTTNPTSKLDIRAEDALTIRGPQPFMTLRDTDAGNARHIIQSVDGGLNLLGDSYIKGTNPSALVRIDKEGRVGIGAPNPEGTFQIGAGSDAMFRIEPSDKSPFAGYIRFGDNTGWQLRIARSRSFSGGPLNTGNGGTLFRFRDDGAFGPAAWPLGSIGTFHLCSSALLFVTLCQGSSLRYKTAIEPYRGGLNVVDRLQPIAFTRKHNGAREVGMGAEDVEKVEPRLTYRNEKGEIEGIRYELLSVVFVNAIKEQQSQIQRQQKLIDELQSTVARLEKVTRQFLSRRSIP